MLHICVKWVKAEMRLGNKIHTFFLGDTFNRHALTALKQLDAAMAAEVSDLEQGGKVSSAATNMAAKPGEATPAPPPPPPPPPPGL